MKGGDFGERIDDVNNYRWQLILEVGMFLE